MFENRPPLVSQDLDFEGGGVYSQDFRPPSAAGFSMISEGGTLLNFQKLENRPPLVSSDPDFEGGVYSQRGGLFSNISPDSSLLRKPFVSKIDEFGSQYQCLLWGFAEIRGLTENNVPNPNVNFIQ